MAWTPFGKSSTATVAPQQPEPHTPQQHLHVQQPAEPQQAQATDDAWLSSFEGQLAVDVYQTASDIVIKAPIAGVRAEDVDIAITDDVVTVKGERHYDADVAQEDYYCQECYYGVFSRSIILPVAVATDQAEATFVNGVLTITIPKAEKARTKKLEIKTI
ncbi:MAG TPA: Hsp20/alpha crystallin family protein [bacterium]|nr:Hsp20/alpha crystallin family protein [bacterium]